jgi:hypothetical protein
VLTARPAFLIPARLLFVVSGGLSLGLGLLHLVDEVQRKEVDINFALASAGIGLLWLVSLVLAWRGRPIFLLVGGLIAFFEFVRQVSTHFVSGTAELTALAKTRGAGATLLLLFLATSCLVSCFAAVEAASRPTRRIQDLRTLPLVLTSVAGSLLLLVYAALPLSVDGSFGATGHEDGALVAVVASTAWIMGALWSARHPIRSTVLVGVSTAFNLVAIYGINLRAGAPSSLQKIDRLWAAVTIATAALALAGLVQSLLPLALAYVASRRNQPATAGKEAARS